MYTVYIVQSQKDGKFYIGYTSDLEVRLSQHNSGQTKSLRGRLPVKIVYTEVYESQTLALQRERQIKSYKGGEAFKKLIKQSGAVLKRL